MKTEILTHAVNNFTNILDMKVEGLSNVLSLTICTQKEDVSEFNTNDYLDDHGWIDGTSYISCRYSYGELKDILKVKENIINFSASINMEEDQCLELFVFVFDAGNGKALLVSNVEEHLSYNDTDFEDIEFLWDESAKKVVHIVGGSITDDSDISNNISQCLVSHPLTKGFKVPECEVFDCLTEELLTWEEYCEYYGVSVFGDDNLKDLKKGEMYFEMFEATNRLVLLNPELFEGRGSTNINSTILNNYKFCKRIPNSVRLEYKYGNSNKFYNVSIDPSHPGFKVDIEYGAINKTLTTDEQTFNTLEEAQKFFEKKVVSKVKSGYNSVI